MNPRERVRLALTCRRPDRIPKALGFFAVSRPETEPVPTEDYLQIDVRFARFDPLPEQDDFRRYLADLPEDVHLGDMDQLRTYHEWGYHPESEPDDRPRSRERIEATLERIMPNLTHPSRSLNLPAQVRAWHDAGWAVAGAPPHLGGKLFEAAYRLRGFQRFLLDLATSEPWANYLLDQLTELLVHNVLLLAHAGVDRLKPILPWGGELGPQMRSPVQASAAYLQHICRAWDHQHGKNRDRDGNPKPGFAEGIALEAKYTLIAEGARGSLAKQIMASHNLAREPQKYGLGIKEIWDVPADKHQKGRVDHYLGYPLDNATAGGGFVYHAEDRKLYVGLVTYLDYADPTLSPFDEFQRFKTHPAIARMLAGGTRISYGARAVTAGGWQSIPTLAFPGGGLIGCAAGFMNAPRLKAIHNAILSGIGAADAIGAALAKGRSHDLGHRRHRRPHPGEMILVHRH